MMKKKEKEKNIKKEDIKDDIKKEDNSQETSENEEDKQNDETELTQEEQNLKKLEEEKNFYIDKYQRTLAEFDNFRKRTMKEKASMYDDGVKDTVEKLLPVIDNLERAILSQTDKENSLYKGVEMTLKQLSEVFKTLGVEPIPALGEKFDPNFHAAVAHEENDEYGENEIIIEMLKGYKYKDKVVRHSMVKVAN